MTLQDLWGLVFESIRTQGLRSILTMLGIIIGMASIVLLSSIGEGTREGVAAQFSQFGTTVIGVQPGKQRTMGAGPGMIGGTTHPLMMEDALVLRRVPGVRYVAPHATGMGEIQSGNRTRYTYVYGTVSDDQHILQWYPRIGSFLPEGDPDEIAPVCVLGSVVAREIFPESNPLGARVKIGEFRFTVIGVMQSKGQVLGFDLDDMAIIPVRRALKMFNREGMDEIHVLAASHNRIDSVMREVKTALMERHDGEEDFTVISQTDMLELIDDVMAVLTGGVLVIAGISLLVGAMGILTIMWVSVHERTSEIGLVKALGASNKQVMGVFLAEAGLLSLLGGIVGMLTGLLIGWIVQSLVPQMWIQVPVWVLPVSLAVSLGIGIVSGVLPAVRAARLDPIEALRQE